MERFFHEKTGLICYKEKPRRVIENGQTTIIEPTALRFRSHPGADGRDWGMYMTDDEDTKLYMRNRGDVMTEQQWIEKTTPAEVLIAHARDRDAAQKREIQEANALIQNLRQKLEQRGQQK